MRVTDEMVDRAWGRLYVEDSGEIGGVRAALEAALADVPEPTSHLELENLVRIADQHQDRAVAAEAKLEKVRAWMDSGESRYLLRGDLRIILDAES